MRKFRIVANPVSLIMIISMFFLVVPCEPCAAALVGTERILDTTKTQEVRQHVKEMLARENVKRGLENWGVDLQEAQARVDALTAEEVTALEKRLQQLPAGGDALGTIVFAALFVFVVLLITDILGHTDVFPFVTKTADQ